MLKFLLKVGAPYGKKRLPPIRLEYLKEKGMTLLPFIQDRYIQEI